jgi:RHS repeat-associated protein
VTLSYSSATVDAMTSGKNDQPSWVGEGWDLDGGSITREFNACDLPQAQGDLCPAGDGPNDDWDSMEISFDGVSSRLLRSDPNNPVYVVEDDPGWRVQMVSTTDGRTPGDVKNYWVVTTTDGTQYFFGRDYQPTTGTPTNSNWIVPVYDPGAPYNCTTDGMCYLTWKWNLDYVVDPNGNSQTYFYQTETNYYNARGLSWTNQWPYNRGGYLTEIDYGERAGSEGAQEATRVRFNTANRCTGACNWTSDYPDTPTDLTCDGLPNTNCPQLEPTFWTAVRLDNILTQVWNPATGQWRYVLRYQLVPDYPPLPDGSPTWMWLRSIQMVSGDGTMAELTTYFDGVPYQNRFDVCCGVSPMSAFRITHIFSPTGGGTTITYGQQHPCPTQSSYVFDDWHYDCAPDWTYNGTQSGWGIFNRWNVNSVVVSDSFSGEPARSSTFSYDAPSWHHNTDDPTIPPSLQTYNDYRGHSAVTVTDATGAYTKSVFYQGMNGDPDGQGGTKTVSITSIDGLTTWPDSDQLAGVERQSAAYNASGVELNLSDTDTISVLAANPANGIFSYANLTDQVTTTTDPTTADKVTQVAYGYDSYLNVQYEIDRGDTSTSSDDRYTYTYYAENTTNWDVDKPYLVQTFSGSVLGQGTQLTATEYGYDGQGIGAVPTAGNLTATIRFNNVAPTTVSTYIDYDSYGRPTKSYDGNGNPTTTGYDPFYGYPKTVTNALNQTTTTVMDPGFGVETTITDPNNDSVMLQYDMLGRLSEEQHPSTGGQVVYGYYLDPNHASPSWTEQITATGANPSYTLGSCNPAPSNVTMSSTLYDGAGETLQTDTYWDTANQVITSYNYDVDGHVIDQSAPYEQPGCAIAPTHIAPNWSQIPTYQQYTFDALGRQTSDAQMTKGTQSWVTQTSYSGWTTTVTPPWGGQTITTDDAFGETTSSSTVVAGGQDTTTYMYDLSGNQTDVIDANNHHIHTVCDQLGRPETVTDPDTGTDTSYYDGAGNVTSSVDAKNQTTKYSYDALNRLTKVANSSQESLESYTYDPAGHLGSLASETSYPQPANGDTGPAYTISYGYDTSGRTTSQTWTIPSVAGALAGSYAMSYGYNQANQPTTVTYPNAETVTTGYDSHDLPATLTSSNGGTYVAATTYNPQALAVNQTLGATANPGGGAVVTRTLGYDNALRLQTVKAGTTGAGSTNLQNLTYKYNNNGDITSVVDGTDGNQKQCYSYNLRNELTSAFTTASTNNCASYDATAGTAPYNQSFTYGPSGNFKTAAGNSYTYSKTQPDTVTAVGSSTYSYDANGDLQTRTVGGTAQTLTYNQLQQLTALTGGTTADSYTYDAAGNRLLRVEGNTSTLFLGGVYEVASNGTATTTTSYYTLGGASVATRTGASLYYTLGDQIGSTSVAYRSDGQQTDTQRYYPFGSIRPGPSNTLPADKTFTGQTLDQATGLLDYGARYYDPSIGRFTQPDPSPTDPLTLNNYSYVDNNPITGTDPTGASIPEDADGQYHSSAPGTPSPQAVQRAQVQKAQAIAKQWFGQQAQSSYSDVPTPEWIAFTKNQKMCAWEYADCVTASALSLGLSIPQANALGAQYCNSMNQSGCDSGGVTDDKITDFILIDLPASLVTGGLVNFAGDIITSMVANGAEDLASTAAADGVATALGDIGGAALGDVGEAALGDASGSALAAENAGALSGVGPGTGIGPGAASINDPAFQLTPGGVANLADNVSMSTSDALDTAQEFLGGTYSEVDSGVFQSPADQNGVFNQVRMTDNDLVEDPRGPHLNFEQWRTGLRGSTRLFNYHVWLPEE